MAETVTGYIFDPADLRIEQRRPGISAFMRIRNGEAFLEQTIRSHIGHLDEIVAVHNQCTDATPDILARLAQRFGPKLRVYHYLDRVFPPGSEGHLRTPANATASVVNYSNFALAQTRCQIVTKLDDDHMAMDLPMGALAEAARNARSTDREALCYSGINLARDADGRLGLPAEEPLCGNGDHWFVRLTAQNYFIKDRRFETFRHTGLRRRFGGFAYWHLKYLKDGGGFANYELGDNPDSRFARKRARRETSNVVDLPSAVEGVHPAFLDRILAPFSDKRQLLRDRARALRHEFGNESLHEALTATTPDWKRWIDGG